MIGRPPAKANLPVAHIWGLFQLAREQALVDRLKRMEEEETSKRSALLIRKARGITEIEDMDTLKDKRPYYRCDTTLSRSETSIR